MTLTPRSSRGTRDPGHQPSAWTVDDAMRMKTTLVSWMHSIHAARALDNLFHQVDGLGWPDEPPKRRLELTQEVLVADTAELAHEDLVYADTAMTSMIAAAAERFPAMKLRQQDFLSPVGLLIFSKPLPSVEAGGSGYARPLTAITWACRDDCFLAIGWDRAHGLYSSPVIGDVHYQGLRPFLIQCVAWQHECNPGITPISVLRTLTALSRQPMTVTDRPKFGQSVRGAVRRTGLDPAAIRRVRLRRPETGHAELEAAREHHRSGSPRGHWVRGHWKNQFYSSIDEHRAIWIEGYPRGDFTHGEVTGPKVLIANGDRETR